MTHQQPLSRLEHFPVSFFSIVMGLAGLVISTQKVEHLLESSIHVSLFLQWVALGVFCVFIFIYLLKIIRYPKALIAEADHPVKINFLPAVSIGFLLLSIVFLKSQPLLSAYLWWTGVIMHLGITLFVMSTWIQQSHFEIKHSNPAWFIPVVGNIVVPVAGVVHAPMELNWFFFSIGLVFWLVLMTIVVNRVIFHHPMPQKLVPTLFILIAPPAVGMIAWFKLTGVIDNFSKILYYFALFIELLLLVQIKSFVRIRFFLSWWAYSFPMAAITLASVLMYEQTHLCVFRYITLVNYCLLVILIFILLIRTFQSIMKKEICVLDDD